jgi:hypothetical protein
MNKYSPLRKHCFRFVMVLALPLVFSAHSSMQLAMAQTAVPAERIKLPAGFAAELVHDVEKGQGSWVSITTDPKGRLITSDQYGGLYRITVIGPDAPKVEPLDLKIGSAQG